MRELEGPFERGGCLVSRRRAWLPSKTGLRRRKASESGRLSSHCFRFAVDCSKGKENVAELLEREICLGLLTFEMVGVEVLPLGRIDVANEQGDLGHA